MKSRSGNSFVIRKFVVVVFGSLADGSKKTKLTETANFRGAAETSPVGDIFLVMCSTVTASTMAESMSLT